MFFRWLRPTPRGRPGRAHKVSTRRFRPGLAPSIPCWRPGDRNDRRLDCDKSRRGSYRQSSPRRSYTLARAFFVAPSVRKRALLSGGHFFPG
jgi:hypothetical protein